MVVQRLDFGNWPCGLRHRPSGLGRPEWTGLRRVTDPTMVQCRKLYLELFNQAFPETIRSWRCTSL